MNERKYSEGKKMQRNFDIRSKRKGATIIFKHSKKIDCYVIVKKLYRIHINRQQFTWCLWKENRTKKMKKKMKKKIELKLAGYLCFKWMWNIVSNLCLCVCVYNAHKCWSNDMKNGMLRGFFHYTFCSKMMPDTSSWKHLILQCIRVYFFFCHSSVFIFIFESIVL